MNICHEIHSFTTWMPQMNHHISRKKSPSHFFMTFKLQKAKQKQNMWTKKSSSRNLSPLTSLYFLKGTPGTSDAKHFERWRTLSAPNFRHVASMCTGLWERWCYEGVSGGKWSFHDCDCKLGYNLLINGIYLGLQLTWKLVSWVSYNLFMGRFYQPLLYRGENNPLILSTTDMDIPVYIYVYIYLVLPDLCFF